jgi:hypothetical protein
MRVERATGSLSAAVFVMGRISGVLLAGLAVQFVFDGLATAPFLTGGIRRYAASSNTRKTRSSIAALEAALGSSRRAKR